MRVAVVGAGPAGLYFALCLHRLLPGARIDIYERNGPDETFGFGVVFSDSALEFLARGDPGLPQLLQPRLETWRNLELRIAGEKIVIDGIGFSAISRLDVLKLLRTRAGEAGLQPAYHHEVTDLDGFGDHDLVVGADGVNSLVRRSFAAEFGEAVCHQENRFIWFGAARPFETLTQSFVRAGEDIYNAHHYRYQPDMSTFIVETDEATWRRNRLGDMTEAELVRHCETVFADVLEGAKLVSNNSYWRQFPQLTCARWFHGRHVLIGDAAHTAHFSVGSGTRLAMEDAQALAQALAAHAGDIASALSAYEAARRPDVDRLVTAATASADWYDRFGEHMQLAPYDFALSYINRTGRMGRDRLKRIAPDFARACQAAGVL